MIRYNDNLSLKIGDLVRLRSGGPTMTVSWTHSGEPGPDGTDPKTVINVIWFDNDNALQFATIDVRTIVSE